ncbi:uncharacterized protein [Epargyreus clarus]|uniref:uncharacterized protein n=1 Tax=Epargyreus clarus TaxID=520877 RepID=UPI003C30A30C
MDANVVECEVAEREGGGCGCGGAASLAVLQDVQRAYEARMALICRAGGSNKLQKQVQLFQSWVGDLVGQNALLARAVEDLEGEVTTRLLLERRRHAERDKSKKSCDKLKECNENLQKEIIAKDREIRRLNKDAQHYEQTIISLRKEMSLSQYHTPDVSKLDAEVTADICCPGMQDTVITSTPNTSRELYEVKLDKSSDVSFIDRPPSPPIIISDRSKDSPKLGSSKCHGSVKSPRFRLDQDHASPERRTADAQSEVKPKCRTQGCNTSGNESLGAPSEAGSAGSDARSRCLENKLLATLEVLKNKEETVRVQAESLALAEARIAALSARRNHRADQTDTLHTRTSADGCCVETTDVTAQTQDDCTCGLEDENMRLKNMNDTLEVQLSELRQRVTELESVLEDKENLEQQYQGQIDIKDGEINRLKQQLADLEEDSVEQRSNCNSLNYQIQQLQVLLQDRSDELIRTQKQCEEHASVVSQLKEELSKAENVSKENGQVRAEVSELSSQVCRWRRQLAASRLRLRALGDELQRTREHSRHVEQHYTEVSALAAQLQEQLQEARSRGAALCAQAQRAVCGVRHWLRRQRQRHRDQEIKIKEQDILIQTLQQRRLPSDIEQSSTSDPTEPCCSKHLSARPRRSEHRCTRTSETTSCSKCPSLRPKMQDVHTSASEMSSCQTAPTPPRRLRKKLLCDDTHCQWPSYSEASAQQPMRADVDTRMSQDSIRPCSTGEIRDVSPTDELLERVERAHEALAAAHRRWRRAT